jgi:RNA polymerase-associated protein LEO1
MAEPADMISELFGDSDSDDEEGNKSDSEAAQLPNSQTPASEKESVDKPQDAMGSDSDSDDSNDFGDALDAAGNDDEQKEGGEEEKEEEKQEVTTLNLRQVVPPCPPDMQELKLPKTINLEPIAYDQDSFVFHETNKDVDDQYDESVLLPVGNVARWRWSLDSEGNRVKESNTRVIKWSDGTVQLLVGKGTVFDLQVKPVQEHNLVFAKLGEGVIECQTRLSKRAILVPSKRTAQDFSKRLAAIKSRRESKKKIKNTIVKVSTQEDDTKLKAARKKKQMQNKAAALRQQKEIGLTENFLEANSDDDEEDDIDESKLRAAQSVAMESADSDSDDVGLSDVSCVSR